MDRPALQRRPQKSGGELLLQPSQGLHRGRRLNWSCYWRKAGMCKLISWLKFTDRCINSCPAMVKLPKKVQAVVGKAAPGTLCHGGAGGSRCRKDQTKNRLFNNKKQQLRWQRTPK